VVIEKIFEKAHKAPHKSAIFFCGRAISYEVFASWISRTRQFLSQQNLPVERITVLHVASLLDTWVFGIALRSLGLTTVAVPSLGTLDVIGLRRIGCAIITGRDHQLQVPPTVIIDRFIQIPVDTCLGMTAAGVPDLPLTTVPAGGNILLTSGTTGARKKVLIDDAGHATSIPRRAQVYGISERSVVNVFSFSPWTTLGYNLPSCVWSMGGSVVIHQQPDLHSSLLIDGITHSFVTPATLSSLLMAPTDKLRRHDSMQLFVTAGPLPRALAAAAETHLTPHIFNLAGSTETGAWALTRIERVEDLRSHRILPSVDVQVVDEDDRPLPFGQVGAVRIRTTDGVTSYFDDDETSNIFFRHGYFYSGDLGLFQADGRLALHGRSINVINLFGDKIPAEPIEQALQDRFAAEGVCIFSMPQEGTEEELYIAIQPRGLIDQAELDSFVRAEVPKFPYIHIHFVNDLPRNDMGKIDRATLKRQILPSVRVN
jgi:long-chain acyl-CoA synthetase